MVSIKEYVGAFEHRQMIHRASTLRLYKWMSELMYLIVQNIEFEWKLVQNSNRNS